MDRRCKPGFWSRVLAMPEGVVRPLLSRQAVVYNGHCMTCCIAPCCMEMSPYTDVNHTAAAAGAPVSTKCQHLAVADFLRVCCLLFIVFSLSAINPSIGFFLRFFYSLPANLRLCHCTSSSHRPLPLWFLKGCFPLPLCCVLRIKQPYIWWH